MFNQREIIKKQNEKQLINDQIQEIERELNLKENNLNNNNDSNLIEDEFVNLKNVIFYVNTRY